MCFLVFNLSDCSAGFFWHRKSGGKRLSVAKKADFLFNQFAIPSFRVMVIVLQLGLLQWFYGKQFSGPVWVTWIFNFKCDDGALCVWSPIFVSDLLPLNNFRCKPGWLSFDTQFGVINRLNDKWAGHQTVGWNVGNFNLKHLVSCLSCSTGQFPNMAAAKRSVINCKLV